MSRKTFVKPKKRIQEKATLIPSDSMISSKDKTTALLPDLSQDIKTWQTIQTILHPEHIVMDIDGNLVCPITHSLMRDPVTTADGQLYEREAIELWLKDHTTSPLPNMVLDSKQLAPSHLAKRLIHNLIEKNPLLKDSEEWHLPKVWISEFKTACQRGDEKAIRELAVRDRRLLVHTFKETFDDQTAVHFAAAGNPKALDVVIELLESRQKGLALAALLQPDNKGRLPIHCAAQARQNAQTLLKLSARMDQQLQKVQGLPGGWPIDFDNSPLNNALACCVEDERIEEICCFLRLGANPQTDTGNGETCVYQAVKQGRFHSLSTLLEAKADPNMDRWPLDDSPLHATIRQGDRRMAAALRQAGARVDQPLKNGQTPLHLAAEHPSTDLLQAIWGEEKTLPTPLLEKADAQGETALHRAAAAGSIDNLIWLLDHGANGQAINAKRQSALHLAASANHLKVISLLLETGTLLSQTDADGNTALHNAALAGATEAVTALLKVGIAVNLKNKAGKTARQLAESRQHQDTIQHHDKTVNELQTAEEKALKSQGLLGIFLLKQQQIIQDQQKQLEEYRLEIKAQQQKIEDLEQNFKKQISDLKNQEIKAQQQETQNLSTQISDLKHKELKRQDSQIRDLETDVKKQLSDLKDREIKPLLKWKADLFTQPLERKLIALRQQEELRLSQIIQQTVIAPPKPKASPEQLKLQDQLIAACKQGDEKAVKALLQQGAKPDIANAKGEQPLGAAVWGMCPDVVNTLLKEAKGIAPMTWQECERHNKKYYNNEVFIIPKFDPQTFGEWTTLLQKMDPNPFIRAYHLKKADELWHDNDTSSWDNFKKYVEEREGTGREEFAMRVCNIVAVATEQGFVSYRSQIKQGVEIAKQPTVALNF